MAEQKVKRNLQQLETFSNHEPKRVPSKRQYRHVCNVLKLYIVDSVFMTFLQTWRLHDATTYISLLAICR